MKSDSNKVVQVAQAMWLADGLKHADGSTIEESWNDSTKHHADYLRRARAAIAAMREPTEAMATAAEAFLTADYRVTYTAMIDAALEEGK